MKKSILVGVMVVWFVANIASADIFGTGANQFTIDFVNISGDTNPASGYGIVNNDYRMGTYEITNDQWDKFKASYGTVTGAVRQMLMTKVPTGLARAFRPMS